MSKKSKIKLSKIVFETSDKHYAARIDDVASTFLPFLCEDYLDQRTHIFEKCLKWNQLPIALGRAIDVCEAILIQTKPEVLKKYKYKSGALVFPS